MKSEKIINILLIIFSLIFLSICFTTILFFQIYSNDELWNFQNIFKMYNGYKIYNDANVIITPLFFFLGALFFKILGPTIITFRIYNICILSLYYGAIFFILRKLNIKKSFSLLYTTLIFISTLSVILFSANYNTLSIFFVFLGIILYLKYYDKKYYNIFQGIVFFLVFYTKQNTGIYYFLAICIFELFDKKLTKKFFINQLEKFLFFLIPLIVSLIILYLNGNFFNFINYVFGGIFQFGNSNININLSFSTFFICIIILSVSIFILLNKKKIPDTALGETFFRNYKFLFIITLTESLTLYPIINEAHLLFILSLYLILLFYFLDTAIIQNIFETEKYTIIMYSICIFLALAVLIKILYNFKLNNSSYTRIKNTDSPFYNICIENNYYEKINIMTQYIKNKNKLGIDVIIIASDSAFTMVSLNQSHREFDLVFNGNLGYNGIQKLIEKIKKSENTEFLIYTNEEDMFWQEPTEIRDYITNNLIKSGEICNYSIYKSNN